MDTGWDASAQGWLDHVGEAGDFGRRFVLDAPMLERVIGSGARDSLDVGCGEGRFCRMMQAEGLNCTGLDPTDALLAAARAGDADGMYVTGRAEALPFADASFDLVVSYLSLIDIDDEEAAIAEMARVLRPGGRVLVANLQGYATCWDVPTKQVRADGSVRVTMKDYLTARPEMAAWGNIRVINHHRPLAQYMAAFLANGLQLSHFAEPSAHGGNAATCERYNNAPWFLMMEWVKPAESASALSRGAFGAG